MNRPLLSVVMPVHQGERWLDAALASIAPEPGVAIEVVIRDSTPERSCGEIAARHKGRLSIDYAHLPEIASWTRKTNLAVEAARAEHVAMLHQDDLWLPQRIAVAAEMIARDPDAVLLLTPAQIVDATGRMLGVWRPPFRPGRVAPDVVRDALLVQNSIAIPTPVFRRDAYRAVGGLDESLWYTPDWDLWLKLAGHGAVIYDPRPATAFRIHAQSLTMTGDHREFADQLALVLDRHLDPGAPAARLCRASARINVQLARGAAGNLAGGAAALGTLLALGPRGMVRYFHASRLHERIIPRLRAKLSRAF